MSVREAFSPRLRNQICNERRRHEVNESRLYLCLFCPHLRTSGLACWRGSDPFMKSCVFGMRQPWMVIRQIFRFIQSAQWARDLARTFN